MVNAGIVTCILINTMNDEKWALQARYFLQLLLMLSDCISHVVLTSWYFMQIAQGLDHI